MAPWKLPFIVVAIAVPIAFAFALGGPGVGVAVGALAGVAIVAIAVRQRPRGPIASAPAAGDRRHVLVVVTCAAEDPAAVRKIAAAAGIGGSEEEPEILVLAPARISFLDRWASDVESARHRAQQNLVATVAAFAKAGIAAEARVGDEDVVQAVEDQLQSFPATEVVLVSKAAGEDGRGGGDGRAAVSAAGRVPPGGVGLARRGRATPGGERRAPHASGVRSRTVSRPTSSSPTFNLPIAALPIARRPTESLPIAKPPTAAAPTARAPIATAPRACAPAAVSGRASGRKNAIALRLGIPAKLARG